LIAAGYERWQKDDRHPTMRRVGIS
jgi:hypothetical protein